MELYQIATGFLPATDEDLPPRQHIEGAPVFSLPWLEDISKMSWKQIVQQGKK